MWLGAIKRDVRLVDGGELVQPFLSGSETNDEYKLRCLALWQFMAESVGHTLHVIPEERFDDMIGEDFIDIGGDDNQSIPLEVYVRETPG